MRALLLVTLLGAVGCRAEILPSMAIRPDASALLDATTTATAADATVPADSGPTDSGPRPDATPRDAMPADRQITDVSPGDIGLDSGANDAGNVAPDAAFPDASDATVIQPDSGFIGADR